MDNTATSTPGTLARFHLGLAADGASCAMVFVDEQQHSIAGIAGFADLEGFIDSLTQAAVEMARRRAALGASREEEKLQNAASAINVVASNFELCDEDGTILGSLIGDSGQIVGIRMAADAANEMTRNMLRTARAVSTC